MEGLKNGRTEVKQDERMVGWKNGSTCKKITEAQRTSISFMYIETGNNVFYSSFTSSSCIRESVDSLCRDETDAPMA